MMKTRSNATFISQTLRWLLIPAAVLALALSAACARAEPSEQEIQATIKALDERIAMLEAIKAEHDAGNEARARPTPAGGLSRLLPSTRTPTEAPAPTAAPTATTVPTATPFALPTPSGPGICGRSPEVQQAILMTLKSTSCRYVTTDELYRVTRLPNLASPLEAGDLYGLVNLEELTIISTDDASALPPGTFTGSAIDRLTVKGTNNAPALLPAGTFASSAVEELQLTDTTIEQSTFAGAGITHLRLVNPALQSGALDGLTGMETLIIDGAESLPTIPTEDLKSLKQLDIQFSEPLPNIPTNYLEHFPQLRKFSLKGSLYGGIHYEKLPMGDDPGRTYDIPTSLFRDNQLLKAVDLSISAYHSSFGHANYTVTAPVNPVATLEHLEYLLINGQAIQGYHPGRPPMTLAPKSPLAKYLTPPASIPLDEWQSDRKEIIQHWQKWTPDTAYIDFSVDNKSYDKIETD